MNKIRTKEEIRHCQQVANEAFKQLFWSISKPIYWSWGVSRIQMTHYKEMPTLMLRVSGMVHKGWVLVSLDEASDTYVITLMNIKKEVKQTLSDIYCDTLGKTIDELVERPADMSDDTYRKKHCKTRRENGTNRTHKAPLAGRPQKASLSPCIRNSH